MSIGYEQAPNRSKRSILAPFSSMYKGAASRGMQVDSLREQRHNAFKYAVYLGVGLVTVRGCVAIGSDVRGKDSNFKPVTEFVSDAKETVTGTRTFDFKSPFAVSIERKNDSEVTTITPNATGFDGECEGVVNVPILDGDGEWKVIERANPGFTDADAAEVVKIMPADDLLALDAQLRGFVPGMIAANIPTC